MCILIVIDMPADGLAPLGTRPSAGMVMTSFGSRKYAGPALQGVISICSSWGDIALGQKNNFWIQKWLCVCLAESNLIDQLRTNHLSPTMKWYRYHFDIKLVYICNKNCVPKISFRGRTPSGSKLIWFNKMARRQMAGPRREPIAMVITFRHGLLTRYYLWNIHVRSSIASTSHHSVKQRTGMLTHWYQKK